MLSNWTTFIILVRWTKDVNSFSIRITLGNTQKTPQQELNKAEKIKKEYYEEKKSDKL